MDSRYIFALHQNWRSKNPPLREWILISPKGALNIETMRSFFHLSPFILLMLDISSDKVFIYSNSADKISSRTEMFAPLKLLIHRWVALEKLYCQLAFQYSNHLRNKNHWRIRRDKMNMVILETQFSKFTFFPFTKHP